MLKWKWVHNGRDWFNLILSYFRDYDFLLLSDEIWWVFDMMLCFHHLQLKWIEIYQSKNENWNIFGNPNQIWKYQNNNQKDQLGYLEFEMITLIPHFQVHFGKYVTILIYKLRFCLCWKWFCFSSSSTSWRFADLLTLKLPLQLFLGSGLATIFPPFRWPLGRS